jgi:hypothetical protein
MTNTIKDMTRGDFMNFFCGDEKLNTLSADDSVEIFFQILQGDSDRLCFTMLWKFLKFKVLRNNL